tara:strand:- start:1376 stop:2320 length:945 start_codon:yes stop_codon:yes gene_type:complete
LVIISTTFSKLKKYKYTNSIISIGSFDGVHLAHKTIFDKMSILKNKKDSQSVVITFDPPPKFILQNKNIKQKHLLTELENKSNLIKKSGVDVLVILSFSKKTASITAENFLNKIIYSFNPNHFVIGYNHNFGYNREGDADFVRSQAKGRFKVHLIKEQINSNKDSISSTKIRKYISKGKIDKANSLLGHQYSLRGFVIKGQGIGKKINFPTINIKPLNSYQLVPFRGVYYVNLIIENQLYSGMCNIGFRPTLTNSKEESIEVHIFSVGIDKNFYKKEVKVFFIKYLREERKFKNLEFLRRQLEKDKQKCLSVEI